MNQDLRFADQTRDFTLAQLGFTGIEFWPDQPNRVRAVDNNPRHGFVIANEVEGNGRTVAFVYAGESSEADGTETFLDTTMMEQSVNVPLVNASLAYGTFYITLPMDLTRRMRYLVRAARSAGQGHWAAENLNTQTARSLASQNCRRSLFGRNSSAVSLNTLHRETLVSSTSTLGFAKTS